MTPTITEIIAEGAALAEKAAPRPYLTRQDEMHKTHLQEHCEIYESTSKVQEILAQNVYIPEAEYMVFAANNFEKLAAEVRRLRAVLIVLGGKPDSANGYYSIRDLLAMRSRYARASLDGRAVDDDDMMLEVLAEIDAEPFAKKSKL